MRVQNISLPTYTTTSSLGWTKICRSTSVFYSDIYVVVKFAVRHICSIGIFVIILWWAKTRRNIQYSQKWANDQLQIVTTCLQRHNFWSPNFIFYNIITYMERNLWTSATCPQLPKIFSPKGCIIHKFEYPWFCKKGNTIQN